MKQQQYSSSYVARLRKRISEQEQAHRDELVDVANTLGERIDQLNENGTVNYEALNSVLAQTMAEHGVVEYDD